MIGQMQMQAMLSTTRHIIYANDSNSLHPLLPLHRHSSSLFRCSMACRGVIALTLKARNKIIESRSTDEHIDKTIVQDLVSDEDALIAKQNEKAQKKLRKSEQKLRERLKAERRNTANKKKEAADEDDDGEIITAFAKGARGKKGR
eukprot:scaffold20007_cov82-Skeletonema_dohrnii-CCMP3373.AAC.2